MTKWPDGRLGLETFSDPSSAREALLGGDLNRQTLLGTLSSAEVIN